jgi:hypothetical protein
MPRLLAQGAKFCGDTPLGVWIAQALLANLLPNPGTPGDWRGLDFKQIQQVIDPPDLTLGFESLSPAKIVLKYQ